MSLETQTTAVIQRIATAMKNIKVTQGNLSTLTTIDKNTLVGALNELKNLIDTKSSIDDSASITSTTAGYSASKINTLINSAIAGALEGEDLSDLADQLTALVQADTGLVSAVASQTFTAGQEAQARENIKAAANADLTTLQTNIGDTTKNFITEFDNIYNA